MAQVTRHLTCIVCPRGCALAVSLDEKTVTSISGNLCPRGKQYAIDECTHPQRTVTTTARTEGGGVVAVKTASPIPKEQMLDCMAAINAVVVPLPVRVGDVILEDVCGTRIIATQNSKPME